jgi:regulation of enolase protein 1 (concanavalin A-like superfamily)
MTDIDWGRGRWTHPPADHRATDEGLSATAAEGSDAWRLTSYGFIHDSEHALLTPFAPEGAMEVTFVADFSDQFDQAGLFLRATGERWVKAGVEFSDGALQLGAVVTDGHSDWSVSPVADWNGRPITIRASWAGDALTLRARPEGEPLRLVRVLPMPQTLALSAGPYLCAPTRAGLRVDFTAWRFTAADDALH